VLAFHHLLPAARNNVVVGIVVALFALIRASSGYRRAGWSWFNGLLGLWLVISPFVLGFPNHFAAMLNNVIAGAVIALLAFTSAASVEPRKAPAPGEH
jgi:hypothetical protein